MDSFQEINEKDRKTVILVTHDAKYLPYAHRVFYMRDGKLRRIAVNPEKQQVKRVQAGETIVTEIELLTRLYPYAEPIELKVKSLVNFATQTIGFRELERMEKAILEVLKGAVDDRMFFDLLTKPVKDFGIGMDTDTAEQMTKRIFRLVGTSHEVAKYREGVQNDSMFMRQDVYVQRIFDYIKNELEIQATDAQLKVLREAIADRIGGLTDGNQFEERMGIAPELGGANFPPKIGYSIARHLEKLIAQGGYVILANELLGAHT
jgi:ABC-type proline/glycine betaine transport system ATPase subunit